MQYVPFISSIEIPFYASLASHKIDTSKLDDTPIPVQGLYEIRPSDPKDHSCRLQIHSNALSPTTTTDTTSTNPPSTNSNSNFYHASGTIRNVNTIEDYRALDKPALIQAAGRQIWDAINDGTIYDCPSKLSTFLIICFSDLKKYRFSYWFAFPALVMDPPWTPVIDHLASSSSSDEAYVPKSLSSLESAALVDEVQAWKATVDPGQHGFFLAKKIRRSDGGARLQTATTNAPESAESQEDDQRQQQQQTTASPQPQQQSQTPTSQLDFNWQVTSLSAYETGFFEREYTNDCFLAFADPSNYTSQNGQAAPGWMLRNLLVLVRQRWKRDRIQVLCYRETSARRDGAAARSLIYDMEISRHQHNGKRGTTPTPTATTASSSDPSSSTTVSSPNDMPKVVGWERNSAGKLAGRLADLTEYMDPKKLADSAVDLNLKLIKWRIAPTINLDKIKETKCLLLGAGTLGSYVSRNLMGWGVCKITFVDNATVSYSNPVRQPLFNFDDCQNGGKRKALKGISMEEMKGTYCIVVVVDE